MRRRGPDPDIWGDLYDRFRRPDDPPRDQRGARRSLSPESRALLIDAALGILGSVRNFVEVAEDILVERRTSGPPTGAADPWLRDERTAAWVPERDGERSEIRDIPLHGA